LEAVADAAERIRGVADGRPDRPHEQVHADALAPEPGELIPTLYRMRRLKQCTYTRSLAVPLAQHRLRLTLQRRQLADDLELNGGT
jgi:hypothetical protein